MTGNIGIPGGNPAGCGLCFGAGMGIAGSRLPVGENPTERGFPSYPVNGLDPSLMLRFRVQNSKIWDALLRGKAGGYPSDFKLLYVVTSNCLNQLPNIRKGVEALQKPEFIVVHEQFMTPTARFADILLPVNTHMERNDIFRSAFSGPYYIYANKAINSLYESKSDFDIAVGIARRLGILDYSDKTEDEWLREIVQSSVDMSRDIPDYDDFRRKGIQKVHLEEPVIAFKPQIEDPRNNPFPTPSGKIEIYSQRLADLNNPQIPPIPKYIETWESRRDPLTEKYPLQLITTHFRRRAHSCFDNIPWLRETESQGVTINTTDARARGITEGELVRVFNNRGEMIIPARVTERITPGVVAIGEGAWFSPDERGIDRGGCPNVLTKDEYAPSGALPGNTCLVQVEKA